MALIEPAYLVRLSQTLLRLHPSLELFGVADLACRGFNNTVQTTLRISNDPLSPFAQPAPCTAEQRGPKNPATSESLMGSHGIGLTNVHLHGRGPTAGGGYFGGFSLANKAAGY